MPVCVETAAIARDLAQVLPTPQSDPFAVVDTLRLFEGTYRANGVHSRDLLRGMQPCATPPDERVPEVRNYALVTTDKTVLARRDLAHGLWFAGPLDQRQYLGETRGDLTAWHRRGPPDPKVDVLRTPDEQRQALAEFGYVFAAILPTVPPESMRRTLPTIAHTLWLDDEMPAAVVANLQRTATCFARATPPRRVHLHLDGTDDATRALREALAREAPDVVVHALRREPFFVRYVCSSSFAQFRHAREKGLWHAQHDAVRYRLLHEHGGILFDIYDRVRDGVPALPTALAIGDVAVGKFSMPDSEREHSDLHVGMLASLPGNPAIDAVSRRSWDNWQAAQCDPVLAEMLAHPERIDPVLLRDLLARLGGHRCVTNVLGDWVPALRCVIDLMDANEDGLLLGGNARAEYARLLAYYFPFDDVVSLAVSAIMRRVMTLREADALETLCEMRVARAGEPVAERALPGL